MCIRDSPIVGSNFSMMEIIKGVAEVTRGNYNGFTLEELRDLEAMKEDVYKRQLLSGGQQSLC